MKIEGAPGVITIFDVKKCRPVPARMQQGLLPPDLLREAVLQDFLPAQ